MNLKIIGFAFLSNWLVLNSKPIRHVLSLKKSKFVYYLEKPIAMEKYPILLAIEGSFSYSDGIESVLRLHKKLAPHVLSWRVGLVTLERRGVNNNQIDEDVYHRYNVPSQRFLDHLRLIAWLYQNPPAGWDGQFIILGGSEGGPLAIKLAKKIKPLACVTIVGCSGKSFKEYIWETITSMSSAMPWWQRFLSYWWYSIPYTRGDYDKQCAIMKKDPDYKKWWFGQTYLYWSDTLGKSEAGDFLSLSCPCLVVAGSKDIARSSTDQLVERAKKKNKDVTYICIEGMAHDALNPQWNVLGQVYEFLKTKTEFKRNRLF